MITPFESVIELPEMRSGLPDQQFHGYHVKHLPHGTDRDARSVAKNIKDVDKAKALAQADHDAGNDAK